MRPVQISGGTNTFPRILLQPPTLTTYEDKQVSTDLLVSLITF